MKTKLIVLGPGRRTRGGVTEVIKVHQRCAFWDKYNTVWISTYRDSLAFVKVLYFMLALVRFFIRVPVSNCVYVHLSEPVSARRKLVFIKLAKFWKKKVIVHFHSHSVETTLHGKYAHVYREIFDLAERVVVLSEYWKTEVDGFVGDKEKAVMIRNPAVPSSQKAPGAKESTKYILFAGTVNHRKGYDVLLKAFSKVAADFPDWRLVFAGNGELGKAQSMARDLGVESSVSFKGWVSGPGKDELFRGASIFCLPSRAEGFPMSILDAIGTSIPIIATPVGGVADLLEDGHNSLMTEPGDDEALACALRRLMSDEAEMTRLVANMDVLKNGTLSVEHCGASMEELLSTVIQG